VAILVIEALVRQWIADAILAGSTLFWSKLDTEEGLRSSGSREGSSVFRRLFFCLDFCRLIPKLRK